MIRADSSCILRAVFHRWSRWTVFPPVSKTGSRECNARPWRKQDDLRPTRPPRAGWCGECRPALLVPIAQYHHQRHMSGARPYQQDNRCRIAYRCMYVLVVPLHVWKIRKFLHCWHGKTMLTYLEKDILIYETRESERWILSGQYTVLLKMIKHFF